MEDILAKLVALPTITDDIIANDIALDYIEDYLAKRGMHCRRDRFAGHGTLLAATRLDNMFTPSVLLAAHIDVVNAREEQFTLRRDGDKLLGRGVYDMKFAIAGYMQIVDDLQQELNGYDFGILIVSDEEVIDVGSKGVIEAGLQPKICMLPDSTAPGWDIETTAKGYWRFNLIARGSSAHGGRPWEGESASFKLIQALHELKSYFEGQGITTDSLNIGKIHGGDAYNIVPSEMLAGVDIRFLSPKNLAKERKMVESLCEKHGLVFEELVLAPAVITDLDHPLIRIYLESVNKVTGKLPKSFISSAGSDAPYFNAAGISCIISCCEGGKHHTKDEWISRKSFLQFAPILHEFLARVAKLPARSSHRPQKRTFSRQPTK